MQKRQSNLAILFLTTAIILTVIILLVPLSIAEQYSPIKINGNTYYTSGKQGDSKWFIYTSPIISETNKPVGRYYAPGSKMPFGSNPNTAYFYGYAPSLKDNNKPLDTPIPTPTPTPTPVQKPAAPTIPSPTAPIVIPTPTPAPSQERWYQKYNPFPTIASWFGGSTPAPTTPTPEPAQETRQPIQVGGKTLYFDPRTNSVFSSPDPEKQSLVGYISPTTKTNNVGEVLVKGNFYSLKSDAVPIEIQALNGKTPGVPTQEENKQLAASPAPTPSPEKEKTPTAPSTPKKETQITPGPTEEQQGAAENDLPQETGTPTPVQKPAAPTIPSPTAIPIPAPAPVAPAPVAIPAPSTPQAPISSTPSAPKSNLKYGKLLIDDKGNIISSIGNNIFNDKPQPYQPYAEDSAGNIYDYRIGLNPEDAIGKKNSDGTVTFYDGKAPTDLPSTKDTITSRPISMDKDGKPYYTDSKGKKVPVKINTSPKPESQKTEIPITPGPTEEQQGAAENDIPQETGTPTPPTPAPPTPKTETPSSETFEDWSFGNWLEDAWNWLDNTPKLPIPKTETPNPTQTNPSANSQLKPWEQMDMTENDYNNLPVTPTQTKPSVKQTVAPAANPQVGSDGLVPLPGKGPKAKAQIPNFYKSGTETNKLGQRVTTYKDKNDNIVGTYNLKTGEVRVPAANLNKPSDGTFADVSSKEWENDIKSKIDPSKTEDRTVPNANGIGSHTERMFYDKDGNPLGKYNFARPNKSYEKFTPSTPKTTTPAANPTDGESGSGTPKGTVKGTGNAIFGYGR